MCFTGWTVTLTYIVAFLIQCDQSLKSTHRHLMHAFVFIACVYACGCLCIHFLCRRVCVCVYCPYSLSVCAASLLTVSLSQAVRL